jgi:hypothetical protein
MDIENELKDRTGEFSEFKDCCEHDRQVHGPYMYFTRFTAREVDTLGHALRSGFVFLEDPRFPSPPRLHPQDQHVQCQQ